MEALRKPRGILALASLFAVLSVLFAYLFFVRRPQAAERGAALPADRVSALVVRKEVLAGAFIGAGMVAVKEFNAADVPANPLHFPIQAVGRVAARSIKPGEVLTQDTVVDASATLGPSYILPENMRAVTVSADVVSGIAGFLKPGDRVDVLATFNHNDDSVTRMILQDIEVMAVSTKTEAAAPKDTSAANASSKDGVPVTLAVTVPEAEKLVLADTRAKIRLLLRPAKGAAYENTTGARESQVSGLQKPGFGSESGTPTAKVVISAPDLRHLADRMPQRPFGSLSRSPFVGLPPALLAPRPATGLSFDPSKRDEGERHITVVRGTQVETVTVPALPDEDAGPVTQRPPAAGSPAPALRADSSGSAVSELPSLR